LFVPKRINSFHVGIIRDHLSEKQGVTKSNAYVNLSVSIMYRKPSVFVRNFLATNHEYQRVITQLTIYLISK